MSIGEDILQTLAERQKRSHEMVRSMLSGEALAAYDASMEHVNSGHSSLESVWHSISPAQRRILTVLRQGDRKLIRNADKPNVYDAVGGASSLAAVAQARSVEKLIRHDLLVFAGAASDRKQIAVPSARAQALFAFLKLRN